MDKFPEMLEELYRNEYYRLYMKAVNELGDFFLAEDAVEEVFVAIIRHNRWWSGLGERDRIKYAEKICISICREFMRKREKIRLVAYRDDVEERENSQISAQVRMVERDAMLRCLEKLNDLDQEIFIEKYFDGLSIKSIAGIHNMTESAVAKRLSRGRKKLKNYVK